MKRWKLASPKKTLLLVVTFEEAAGQAVLEAWAVPRALDKWGISLQGTSLVIKSDSTIALTMLQKLGSARRALNFISAEIALRLEKYKVRRLVPRHARGRLNAEADWLPRLADGGEKPRIAQCSNQARGRVDCGAFGFLPHRERARQTNSSCLQRAFSQC